MNSKTVLALSATGALMAAIAGDEAQGPAVLHLSHDQVAAAFAKGATMLATNNFKVMAGRRTAPGEVEIHDHDTDIFYILEGSATFVTGGKAVEAKASGPGETRARAITGGNKRHLAKGNVIVIPKGVPHWFKDVKGLFLYYVVKVSE